MKGVDRRKGFLARSADTFDPTVTVLRAAAVDADRSRLPQMAAALSYRTIFGLLPIVAIGLWILHRFASPEDLAYIVRRVVDMLGLSKIVIDQSAAVAATDTAGSWFVGPPIPGREGAPPGTPEDATVLAASAGQISLENWVTDFVDRINRISFRAIGVVGIVMLIYAAVSMVVEVERAFNQIFRVPRGRSWTRRLPTYWTLLTMGPIGLFITFYGGQRLNAWIERISEGWLETGTGATSLVLAGILLQIIVSGALLVVIYTVVPNTRVRFTPAVVGALTAATIFEATKFGFARYVEFSAKMSYARLYGSLALIPLFLLWVYVSWTIVLFGLQLTYQLQHGRARTRAQPLVEIGPTLVEPAAAMTVMTAAAAAFKEGVPLTAPEISQRTRLSEGVVRLVLESMVERGFLLRVEGHVADAGDSVEPAYTLARPPETIRVADLLAVGFQIAGGTATDPLVAKMRSAQIAAVGEENLAAALAESGMLPRPSLAAPAPSTAAAGSPASSAPAAEAESSPRSLGGPERTNGRHASQHPETRTPAPADRSSPSASPPPPPSSNLE